MTYTEYAALAHASANHTINPTEILVGLVGEAPESLEEIKRMIRSGGEMTDAIKVGITKECGDTLWYASETATLAGYTLEEMLLYAKSSAAIYRKWPNLSPLMAALKMVASSGEIASVMADHLLLKGTMECTDTYRQIVQPMINTLAWLLILVDLIDVTMEDVMQANLDKLAYRRINGK